VLTSIAPLANGAAGLGLAPAAVADVDAAFATASAAARNLATQGIPTRIDVQEFLLAARTLDRTLARAPGLKPDAARVIDGVTALLPAMADAIDVPFSGDAPTMTPAQARVVLGGAAPAPASATASVAPATFAAPPAVVASPTVAPAMVAPPTAPAAVMPGPTVPSSAGLITVPSRHGFADTLTRFDAAVRAKGWKVFAVIDHAAAAREAGQSLRPRTVVLFGNPAIGTDALRAYPTLAMDLPMRALIWEDGSGAVWLTTNSADYVGANIYGRHGMAVGPGAPRALAQFFDEVTRQATE
jgi:uncharacterized protein (DUF302 family)